MQTKFPYLSKKIKIKCINSIRSIHLTDRFQTAQTLKSMNSQTPAEKSNSFINSTSIIQSATGIIVLLLGLLVLVGWYINSKTLIQIFPAFVPMQYNTALGFLLCGIGLLCLFKFRKFSLVCGILVFLLGFLTLIQYIFGFSLGIDEFLMEAYITVKTSHPGRMAPNTALCFMLSGAALVLQIKIHKTGYWAFAVALIGSSTLQQEIGLGRARAIRTLLITWPATGRVQRFEEVGLNQIVRIREGDPTLKAVPLKRLVLAQGGTKPGSPSHEGHR